MDWCAPLWFDEVTFLFFISLERVSRMSCSFPRDRGQAGQPAVPQVLLCALLEERSDIDFFEASEPLPQCHCLSKTTWSFLFQKSMME